MNKAFVNGIHICYETLGEGFPIIAISGKDSSMDWWHPDIKASLSAANRLILLDNRGSGRSDAPSEAYGISDMAKDVIGLMDELGIGKAHVLGQSMGGMIAQEIAIEHPERVEKLILCSTACGVKRLPPTFRMIKWLFRNPTEFSPQETLDMLYPKPYMSGNPEEIDAFVQRMRTSPPNPASIAMHRQASKKFDSYERLGRIGAPTLIVHGELDWVFRPMHARVLHRRIADSRLLMYANSGHGVLSQERRKVLEEIHRFMD